jgi:large subunit ribosomal protein L35
MPKMKTNSSAKKRFSKVGGGKKGAKIKRSKAFRRHLMTRKSTKQNRQARKGVYFSEADAPSIRLLLPY